MAELTDEIPCPEFQDASPLVCALRCFEDRQRQRQLAARVHALRQAETHWLFLTYSTHGFMPLLGKIYELLGSDKHLEFSRWPCLLLKPPAGVELTEEVMGQLGLAIEREPPAHGTPVFFGRHGAAEWQEDEFFAVFVDRQACPWGRLRTALRLELGLEADLPEEPPGTLFPLSAGYAVSLMRTLGQIEELRNAPA